MGVLLAAGLVTWLRSSWPDLLIGAIITGLVLRGALRIRQRIQSEAAVESSVAPR